MVKKTLTFLEEVVLICKVVSAASVLLAVMGAFVWNMYARDLVAAEAQTAIASHNMVYDPIISKHSEDILTLKDTQMLTYLSLKKLLTRSQSLEAEKELAEIKRRQ